MTSLLFLLAALLVPPPVHGQALRTLTGQVVHVVDGDTIHVRIGNQVENVRYIGMNAPELHHPTKGIEPLAREATEANRKLVEGQTVRLKLDVQDEVAPRTWVSVSSADHSPSTRSSGGLTPAQKPIFFFISWSIQIRAYIGPGRTAPARSSPL